MYENMKGKKIFYDEFFDPLKLIKKGWVPELDYFNRPERQVYLAAMNGKIPEDTFKYFHGGVSPEEFLRKRRVWVRAETEYQSKYRALAMMFNHPDLLWSSMHPKTDMKMFQQENYLKGEVKNNILFVGEKKYRIYGRDNNNEEIDDVAFPVSRYAESVDIGLYHTTKIGNFCGTFYYIEPESTVYLISHKVIFSRTKTAAAQLIAEPQTKFAVWEKQQRTSIRRPKYQKLYDEGKLRHGLLYTPIQAHTELGYKGYHDSYSITDYPVYMGAMSIKEYDINHPGLYGVEDEYDQPLCIEMKRQGIEVACFTEMIGAFGIVSELLDARERNESFSSLVYT